MRRTWIRMVSLVCIFLFALPVVALPEIDFNNIIFLDIGESRALNISLLNGSYLSELNITLEYKKGIEVINITSTYPILKKELSEENGKLYLFLNILTKNITDNETIIASIEVKALSKGYYPMKVKAVGYYKNGTFVDVLERHYGIEIISGKENVPEPYAKFGPLLMFMVLLGAIAGIAIIAGILIAIVLIIYAVLRAKGKNIDVRYLIVAIGAVLIWALVMFLGVVYG